MRSLSYLSLDPSLLRPVLLRRRQSKGLSFGASILSFEAVTSPEVAVSGTVGAVFVVSACGGALIWTLQLVIFFSGCCFCYSISGEATVAMEEAAEAAFSFPSSWARQKIFQRRRVSNPARSFAHGTRMETRRSPRLSCAGHE
ncbi:hypothetical protein KSP40_PGU019032 [Platanthera guangdongensis]|uniref:Uncharacterized protein n=1 Tax=Platanthera guangdongensis TaxID=2320717 RepID=A0ABR2MMT2_9ASPA